MNNVVIKNSVSLQTQKLHVGKFFVFYDKPL